MRSQIALDPNTVFPREQIAKGYNEMTIAELRARAVQVRKAGFPPVEETMALQQKFSIPVACLVFALLGLGLGVSSRKDGKMASFVLGISVIFVYWMIMYGGRAGAKAQVIPAWLAMWLPNFLLAPAGVALLVWRNRFSERQWRLPSWLSRSGNGRTVAGPTRLSRRVLLKIRIPHGLVPRPHILDWYISRLYVRIVAVTFAALLGLFYIAEFIDLSDKVFKGQARPALLILYFCFKTPYFVYYVLPIAGLIGTLVTYGLLTRNSELVVMKACGISVYRAAVPAVLFAALAGATLFVLEENVLATTNTRWRSLQRVFRGVNTPMTDMLNRGWIVSRDGNSIYHYDSYNKDTGEIASLSTYTFDKTTWRLVGRSSVARARYSPALSASTGTPTWVERDGWSRDFTSNKADAYVAFGQRRAKLEEPRYFGDEAPDADRMNYVELKRYIAELRAGGFNVTRASVDLYRKLAFPFIAIIMTLIAVPFAVTMGRRGAMYGIGLGVVLAVTYWVTNEVFIAFGTGGLLNAALAAWAPNILFGFGAMYMVLTVRT